MASLRRERDIHAPGSRIKPAMVAEIHWQAIAIRLVLTVIAGGLLGIERSRTGHVAGLRTTLLVTLAASVSMIQMNLLIQTNGKPPDSYAVMDLMRLPLGILTGVGFIGAGVIVRKKEIVLGVTTAATIWFSTVVGLCLGGGQLILGSVSTLLGFCILWALRRFETRIEHYRTAELKLTLSQDSFEAEELKDRLLKANFQLESLSVSYSAVEHSKTFACEVRWPSGKGNGDIPHVLKELERIPSLVDLEWRPIGTGPG